jgi:hypothetical protein
MKRFLTTLMLAVSFAVSLFSQELMTPEKFLGYKRENSSPSACT